MAHFANPVLCAVPPGIFYEFSSPWRVVVGSTPYPFPNKQYESFNKIYCFNLRIEAVDFVVK